MPRFTLATGPLVEAEADLVAVTAAKAPAGGDADDPAPPLLGPGARATAAALDVDLEAELQALRFDASVGAVAHIPTRGRVPAATLLVVGVGGTEDATLETLRRAGAAVADAASRLGAVATSLPWALASVDLAASTQAVVEGLALGAYRFTTHKTDPDLHALEHVAFHAPDDAAGDGVEAGIEVGTATADAAAFVRDLVNLPPGDKRPPALADRVAAAFDDVRVEVSVLDQAALEEGGYGGLLGVGAGSSTEPRLVELTYAPEGAQTHVALVGKGITFDSGGLSLKPNDAMVTMKMDMAGAAAVAGVVKAAAALRLPVRLTGLLALAENMPSGTAIRPSDVLTVRGGTTVEVLNTDAEGRLVLADALAHASEAEPDVIVDVATLTGAAIVALGAKIGAVMTTDDDVAAALVAAGETAGEPFWQLPLGLREYGDDLDGDVADVKNHGWKGAGAIRAAIFLHRFVADGIPWAHLDIAGVGWADERDSYRSKGGTGVPVRTLVQWLRDRSA